MTGPRASGAERLGVIRGPGEDPRPFKEWLHLCATGPDGFLLLNLSHERGHDRSTGRAIIVARYGDLTVARVVEPKASDWAFDPGRAAARVADHRFAWVGDRARLELSDHDPALRGTIELRVVAAPAWTGSIPMPAGSELSWVVAPHWRVVGGSLRIHDHPVDLSGWQAYHDHNWGRFRWADDFAWEWAFGHSQPDVAPACVVFGRLTDRAGACVLSKVLMVWWEGRPVRTFRGGDVQVRLRGEARQEGGRPVPGAATLLLPRRMHGVPAVLEVHARTHRDELTTSFESGAVHRFGVPEDGSLTGYRVLHEIESWARCAGTIGGQRIEIRGPGSTEILRHV